MRRIRNDRPQLFYHFFLRYLAVLAIIAAITIPIYALVIADIREHEVENRLSRLAQFRDRLDDQFRSIDEIFFRVTWSRDLSRVMSLPPVEYGSQSVFLTIVLQRLLAEQISEQSILHDLSVYFFQSDMLVSANWIVFRLPLYYGALFQIQGLDYESWMTQYVRNSASSLLSASLPAIDRAEEIPLVLYSRRVMLEPSTGATIMAMVDERRIADLFVAAGVTSRGRYQISTTEGDIISDRDLGLESERSTDGSVRENVVSLEIGSNYRDWTIHVEVPGDEILANVWSTGPVAGGALLAAILLGLIPAAVFARQMSRPIGRVLDQLENALGQSTSTGNGGVAAMEREVTALLEHDKVLSARLEEQRLAVKTVYLDRLLKGQVDRDEVARISQMIGIDLTRGDLIVCVISLNRDPEGFPHDDTSWRGIGLVATEQILRRRGRIIDAVQLTGNRIVVLVRVTGGPREPASIEAVALLEQIAHDLQKSLHADVAVGVGIVASTPYEIWRSYQSANAAVDEMSLERRTLVVLGAPGNPAASRGYYYPLEVETEIAKLARAGDTDDIETVLASVIAANSDRSLEFAELDALVGELRGTMRKIATSVGYDLHESQIEWDMPDGFRWDSLERHVSHVLHEICETVNHRKRSHNDRLADRMRRFVEENIADPQLSLGLLAAEFSLSETYVSHFFTEQTGVQYSRYVENLRMTAARDLLVTTDVTIDEVAESVGYTSTHGFRRAFKRVEGTNPNEFRQAARQT